MNLHSRRAPRAAARDLFRNGILEAAEAEFADRGYHEARIQDIARRARIAVGTVYNHFDDKEALLSALLDARTAEMIACLASAEDDPKDFAGALERRIGRLLAHAERRRGTWAVLLANGLAAGGGPAPSRRLLGARARRRLEKLQAAWLEVIDLGLREGVLAPMPREALAGFLAGVVRAMVAPWVLGNAELDGAAPIAARLFLRGAGS